MEEAKKESETHRNEIETKFRTQIENKEKEFDKKLANKETAFKTELNDMRLDSQKKEKELETELSNLHQALNQKEQEIKKITLNLKSVKGQLGKTKKNNVRLQDSFSKNESEKLRLETALKEEKGENEELIKRYNTVFRHNVNLSTQLKEGEGICQALIEVIKKNERLSQLIEKDQRIIQELRVYNGILFDKNQRLTQEMKIKRDVLSKKNENKGSNNLSEISNNDHSDNKHEILEHEISELSRELKEKKDINQQLIKKLNDHNNILLHKYRKLLIKELEVANYNNDSIGNFTLSEQLKIEQIKNKACIEEIEENQEVIEELEVQNKELWEQHQRLSKEIKELEELESSYNNNNNNYVKKLNLLKALREEEFTNRMLSEEIEKKQELIEKINKEQRLAQEERLAEISNFKNSEFNQMEDISRYNYNYENREQIGEIEPSFIKESGIRYDNKYKSSNNRDTSETLEYYKRLKKEILERRLILEGDSRKSKGGESVNKYIPPNDIHYSSDNYPEIKNNQYSSNYNPSKENTVLAPEYSDYERFNSVKRDMDVNNSNILHNGHNNRGYKTTNQGYVTSYGNTDQSYVTSYGNPNQVYMPSEGYKNPPSSNTYQRNETIVDEKSSLIQNLNQKESNNQSSKEENILLNSSENNYGNLDFGDSVEKSQENFARRSSKVVNLPQDLHESLESKIEKPIDSSENNSKKLIEKFKENLHESE